MGDGVPGHVTGYHRAVAGRAAISRPTAGPTAAGPAEPAGPTV